MSGSLKGHPVPQKSKGARPPRARPECPSLTRFLTSAESPYEGPLLNCVELMPATAEEPDGRIACGVRPPETRGFGPRPRPLIGPRRTCPYKAGTRRIPEALDFLNPLSRPQTAAPAEHSIPRRL